MRLRWIGPFACPTGYGRATHDYLAALHRAGVDLDIVPIHDADPEALEPRYHHLLDFVHRDGFEPTHQVIHTIPRYAHEFVVRDLDPGPGVIRIAMTTWETDKLPTEIAELLDGNFDAVIVPCHWNADVFTEAGIPDAKVHAVPHCYDPSWWLSKYGPAPRPPERPYVLYSIGAWAERKNPLGLLKAYLSEFTADDDVVLRIVCPQIDQRAVQSLVSRMGLGNLPRVEFITKRLTEDELFDIHVSSHCFVSATRGEGWGLGAFEAAIVSNSIIMTDFGGHRDFLDAYETYAPVGYQLTPAVPDEMQVQEPFELAGLRFTAVSTVAPTGISADQNWAEPDLHDLQAFMRASFNTPTPPTREYHHALAPFAYEVVGPQLRDTLARLEIDHERHGNGREEALPDPDAPGAAPGGCDERGPL